MSKKKPENMTEYRDMMLSMHMDTISGLERPADLKEHANMFGKVISSCQQQLEQKKFLKDDTPVEFLEGK
jgi:hypothetical protein